MFCFHCATTEKLTPVGSHCIRPLILLAGGGALLCVVSTPPPSMFPEFRSLKHVALERALLHLHAYRHNSLLPQDLHHFLDHGAAEAVVTAALCPWLLEDHWQHPLWITDTSMPTP